MSLILPKEFAGLAKNLGEPFKIMTHWPTVVVQCQCDAKTILPLIGVQHIATCPACQHRFVIMTDMKVQIGAMRPAADPPPVVQ